MTDRLKKLQKFCHMFEAHVEPSERRFYKRETIDFRQLSDTDFYTRTEEVRALAIHLPEHRIDDLLGFFDEQKFHEMKIRDNVPAVKKAYEQYRLLLKMCGGDFDARY